jgi:hypothetical protein
MTRYVEGDTSFEHPGIWFRAERAWRDSFAYGTSTTEDRKRIHEQMTGLDLDWFYNEWVFMAGYPNYTVNWFPRETADGWEIVIDVDQNNGSQAPTCFHMPVEALVSRSRGSDTLLHWSITSNPQRDVFPLNSQPTGITFNPGQWILEKHTITTGIENEIALGAKVSRPTLDPISPNPANAVARVRVSLPRPGKALISVYDALGRCVLVRQLVTANCNLAIPLDTRGWSSGVYLVRLDAEGATATQKLVVQK